MTALLVAGLFALGPVTIWLAECFKTRRPDTDADWVWGDINDQLDELLS